MAVISLESIIVEQRQRISSLQSSVNSPYYNYDDRENYQRWLAKAIRFININYPNDKYVQAFEQIAGQALTPQQQTALLTILEAIADLPTIIPQESNKDTNKQGKITVNTNISNTNTQSQSQEQSFAVSLFLDAIKDDLTGRQIKELKEIITVSGSDKEKTRNGIIKKLKSFGSNVAANIVSNILTNPAIWGLL